MPIYSVQGPDNRVYDIEGPEGASDDQVIGALQSHLATNPPAPAKAAPSSASDIALTGLQSLVGGGKSLLQGFGADVAPAESLDELQKWLGKQMTPERQAELKRQAEETKAAAKSGDIGREILTAGKNVAQAPVLTAAQAIGSSVLPVAAGLGAAALGTSFGAPLTIAAGVGLGIKYLIGALQGAGEVKGNIYEEVEKELIAKNVPKDTAKQIALQSQDYLGDNFKWIASAFGLGGWASGTGVEKDLFKFFGKKTAADIAAETARKAATGYAPRVATTVGKEVGTEALQSGQGQGATNVALTGAGIPTPTSQGMAGAATTGALSGALGAVPISAYTERGASAAPTAPPAAGRAPTAPRYSAISPPAPVGPAPLPDISTLGYGDLTKLGESLRTLPQTPAIREQRNTIKAELEARDVDYVTKQREAAAAAKAAEPTPEVPAAPVSTTDLQQVEMRAALPEGELAPQLDLFGAPLEPAPDVAPAVETTVTPKELEAQGQQRLPLRRTPEGQPTTTPVAPVAPAPAPVAPAPVAPAPVAPAPVAPAPVAPAPVAPAPVAPAPVAPAPVAAAPIAEPIKRPAPVAITPETAPTVLTPDVFKALGIGPTAVIRKSEIAGKDITNVADATQIKRDLEAYRDAPGRSEGIKTKIDAYLGRPEFKAIPEPVNVQPAPAPIPPTVQAPQPGGGQPSVEVPSQPAGAAPVQPGTPAPAAQPAPPVGLGLAPTGQPAGAGVTPAKPAAPALKPTGGMFGALVKPGAPDIVPAAVSTAPDVDSIKRFTVGVGSIIPKVVARDKPTYHETNTRGLESLLDHDKRFDINQIFVSDNADLALGQQGNAGVFIEFRPNSISGKVHSKLGTSEATGQEFRADLVAPRAINSVTIKDPAKFTSLPATRRILNSEFTKTTLPDGSVQYVRKGTTPTQALPITWTAQAAPAAAPAAAPKGKQFPQAKKESGKILIGKKAPPAAKPQATQDAEDTIAAMGRTLPEEDKRSYAARVKDTVAEFTPKREGTDSWATTFANKTADMLDASEPLKRAVREEARATMPEGEATDLLLQLSLSQSSHANSLADAAIQTGGLKYNPETYKFQTTKSDANLPSINAEYGKMMETYGITLPEARYYASTALESKRMDALYKVRDKMLADADTLDADGKKAGAKKLRDKAEAYVFHMEPDEVAEGLKLFQTMPEIQKIDDIKQDMRSWIRDLLQKTGVWSEEHGQWMLDNAEWIPFNREFADTETIQSGFNKFVKGLQVKAKEQAFKGSMREVHDVVDNFSNWASYSVRSAIANQKAQELAQASLEFLPDTEVRKVSTPEKGAADRTVSYLENGNTKYLEFESAAKAGVFRGMESFGRSTIPFIGGMLDWSSNVFRASITNFPLFPLYQLPMDAISAVFVSGLKPKYAFKIPLTAVAEAVRTIRGASQARETLREYGAVGVSDYNAMTQRTNAEIEAGLKKWSAWSWYSNLMQNVNMGADNAVRQAVYLAARDAGLTEAEAVEKAFEIINFRTRLGNNGLTQAARNIVFFNSFLAATRAAHKVLTSEGISPGDKVQARKSLLSNMAWLAGISVMMAMANVGDEEYEKMSRAEQASKLTLPGMHGWGIPMRPDVFTLPKFLAESLVRQFSDKYADDPAKLRKNLWDVFWNSTLSGPMPVPQPIKLATELATNYSFFTQRPIVGQGLEKLESYKQYSASTSEVSKFIGETTKRLLESAGIESQGLSPAKLDYFIRGMLGMYGGTAMLISNSLVGNKPPESLRDTLASVPGMSRIAVKEFDSQIKNDFYDLAKQVDTAVTTLNKIKKTGKVPEAMAYMEKNAKLLQYEKDVEAIQKNLSDARAAITQAGEHPTWTDAQKQAEIRRIRIMERQFLQRQESLIKEMRTKALG